MALVQWDLASFRTAKFVGREGSLMEFHARAGLPADEVAQAFAEAVDETNDALAAEEAAGRELYALVSTVVSGPRGPVANFKECEPLAALRLFLTTLAEALERRGVSGRLVPLSPQELDRWFGNNSFSALTLLLRLEIDLDAVLASAPANNGRPDPRWWADGETTAAVVDPLVDWVLEAGTTVDLSIGFTAPAVDASEVPGLIRGALAKTPRLTMQVSEGPGRMRRMLTTPFGSLIVHDFDPGTETATRLNRLIDLLAAAGPYVREGWIQQGATSVDDLYGLLSYVEPTHSLADPTQGMPWRLFHLEDDHVYDARPVQVLTTRQLARTRDLDPGRWSVRPLERGRTLVVHARPDLWVDALPPWDPLPTPAHWRDPVTRSPVPPDVLAQARADFGDAIMTAGTLAARPYPDVS